jgi:sphinganine-1-phosphate aldolase
MKPAEILCVTLLGVLLANYLCGLVRYLASYGSVRQIKVLLFRFAARFVPQVRAQIELEMTKMRTDCVKKFADKRRSTALRRLPQDATPESEILARITREAKVSEGRYAGGGNVTGAVYIKDESHWNFISDVMRLSIVSNPLHIDEFIYVTQMEAEIVRWTLDLYNGDDAACGLVSSGGTESIVLSMLAYREQARAERGITQPNMVMSETAHCAFDKGGHYFGIEIRKVPITKDFTADLNAMKAQIDSNTICLVASAPEYAFGNYDPVAEIAALAQAHGCGCHSDCCLGSYVNPFIKELGYPLAYEFDFSVPGVTSISCDPHKYAYGPKGCSILLFRDKQTRDYQFFCNTEWNGGLYATTCIAGSRPGAVIAGTWASMLKNGKEGLKAKASRILHAQAQIKKALKDDKDIQICSHHTGSIFSMTSSAINAIALGEVVLKQSNWTVALLQRPAGLHLAITYANCENWEQFVKAIKKGI